MTPTVSTPAIARSLKVSHVTIWRWAERLGYPAPGYGRRIRVTLDDARVMAIWASLSQHRTGGTDPVWPLRMAVADAVRTHQAPFIVIDGDRCEAFDTWEAAVHAAAECCHPTMAHLIDVTALERIAA